MVVETTEEVFAKFQNFSRSSDNQSSISAFFVGFNHPEFAGYQSCSHKRDSIIESRSSGSSGKSNSCKLHRRNRHLDRRIGHGDEFEVIAVFRPISVDFCFNIFRNDGKWWRIIVSHALGAESHRKRKSPVTQKVVIRFRQFVLRSGRL